MSFGISLVLARLLAPEYFGLMGMATVITGFARTFRDLGLHSVIIQKREIDDRLLSTIYWVNLLFCVVLCVTLAGLAPLVGWCYGDSRVPLLVAVLSLDFLLAGATIVPTALLNRRLAFRQLAVRELGGSLIGGLAGVVMAFTGFGVWALVANTLASSLARLVLVNWVCPFWPALVFDWSRLRGAMQFGLNLTGFSIVNYFARNADNLIIGIFLGPVALGFYGLAYKIMLMPRNSVSYIVMKVLFPKLSRVQDDDAKLADYYLRAIGAIAFVTFPAMTGLAIVAPDMVPLVLGDNWKPAVPLIILLAPLGAVQSIGVTAGQVFLSKGRADLHFRWGLLGSAVYVTSFLAGLPWGVTGVATSYLMASLILMPAGCAVACRLVEGMTMRRLVGSVSPYAICSLLMAATTAVFQFALLPGTPMSPAVRLAATVLVGVVTYATLILVWRPAHAVEVLTRFIPLPGLRRYLVSARC